MKLNPKYYLITFILSCTTLCQAQNVDVANVMKNFREQLKGVKKVKIAGGIASNLTYAKGTAGALRDPLNYFINGNLSITYMKITIPISLNYTNAGFTYNYTYPRAPNRLSIHPKYKAFTGHIGDFSMNFSPYTMAGFQMVGLGLDVLPTKSKLKYNAFYGRLQKAVEYKPGNGSNLANFKRMGAGLKLAYDKAKTQTSLSMIRIFDVANSLAIKPDSLNIYPKTNFAMSGNTKLNLRKGLQWETEIGVSFLTNDVRAKQDSVPPIFRKISGLFFKTNATTNFYKAVKTNLSYTLGSSTIGVGYERVDPGYQTLGAYYFTNDLENITANFAQQLFKGKFNIAMNVGFQRDDLKKEKTGSNNRVVAAINGSINASKKVTSTFSYSNFKSFTNIRPQFNIINQLTPYDNLDTLNFAQVSQSANAGLNVIFKATKELTQNLNINLNMTDAYDQQGGIVARGNASQLYNLAMNFTHAVIPKNINGTLGFNATYNTIGTNNTLTLGPTLAIGKALFNKKIRTNIAASYNKSMAQSITKQEIITGRFNASYTLMKKHQLGLNSTFMARKVNGIPAKDFNTVINYSYTF